MCDTIKGMSKQEYMHLYYKKYYAQHKERRLQESKAYYEANFLTIKRKKMLRELRSENSEQSKKLIEQLENQ